MGAGVGVGIRVRAGVRSYELGVTLCVRVRNRSRS